MVRVPLGTSDFVRSVSQTADIPLVNRYFEYDPTNLEDQVALLARPSLRKWLTVGSGPIRGVFSQPGAFNDALFVVSGLNLYKIDTDETITDLGAVSSGLDFVSMAARVSGTDNHLFIADGGGLEVWDGTTLSSITTPDSCGIISVGHIAGYIICVVAEGFDKDGRFYWIKPGEVTIDPLDFATAERAPDPLWSVRVVGDRFWLFGTSTTEIWYLTGDPATPFIRTQGMLFDRGVWDGSDIQIKDEVLLVDTDGVVYRISGAGPQRISTNAIEQRIREAMNEQRRLGL